MEIKDSSSAADFIYSSFMRIHPNIPKGLDSQVRHPEYTRGFLDELGAPDKKMTNIMVTGSKGKGSVSIILAALLQAHGLKVGLFTSPHLISFEERIRINGKAINEEDLVKYTKRLQPMYEELEASLDAEEYIGPVGAAAVVAMQYFLAEKTDINVVECGRGARFDDVNQIKGDYGVINKVFLEHTGSLGETLQSVAFNKAGLIKEGMKAAFTARQEDVVLKEIAEEAKKRNVSLYVCGKGFYAENVSVNIEGTTFDLVLEDKKMTNIYTSLVGHYQAENCALAIKAAQEILGEIDEEKVRLALKSLRWFGRMEIIDRKPFTLLDGCISSECMESIKKFASSLNNEEIISVIGIPEEKDFLGVIKIVDSFSKHIIMTHAKNDFLKFSERQVLEARGINKDIYFYPEVKLAKEKALELAGEKGVILFIGTQSLIKDVKMIYGQPTLNL